ncbi:hypothetical protein IGI04_034501 [Brassica rapa subsp. trilocularis]|uniref:MULE transposase domain-containing protein n=1 Tax=Brassica rapa subsp. trilocularis TaxID=1813537 RepID=A0ABQ7LCR0_BRACM|nr:hypothetical protein IGI04_034501 [Brassica rapa subsp. trilocularis]
MLNNPYTPAFLEGMLHLYSTIGREQVYNHAQHVICVVHLWRNVMAKYKSSRLANLMSAAARAFTVTEFNKKFIEIQKISPNCTAYLVDIDKNDICLTLVCRNEKARQTENENVVAVRDTTGHPAATQYDKL